MKNKEWTKKVVIEPCNDDEWRIHALNIHGTFFQRWCVSTLEEMSFWEKIKTEYPVEFPPPNGHFRGKESSLDIRASIRSGSVVFTFIIECKKNNPSFTDWVFYPKSQTLGNFSPTLSCLRNEINEDGNWSTLSFNNSNLLEVSDSTLADEGRETKGKFDSTGKDKTKTSNAAITEAAYQVTLATHAIQHEELEFSQALLTSRDKKCPWLLQVIFPVIVTTANLYVCDFKPEDVSVETGEIPLSKANLRRVNSLYFEYPIPSHLQLRPSNLTNTVESDSIELFVKKHIFVVHSGNFYSEISGLAKLVYQVRAKPN